MPNQDGYLKLCDFGSCITGYMPTRTPEERSKAEENIGKETTQMYRAPEMVDLYLRDELTEKTDIWVLLFSLICLTNVGSWVHFLRAVLQHSPIPRCRKSWDSQWPSEYSSFDFCP